MSICLDEFWIIVSITQFSYFWVMSYENWKHIWGVFNFQNSIFNGIFVIKPTYPAAMFNKRFFFFFFGETQPQLLKLKTGSELRCQTGGLRNWGILSDEWWMMKIEWWQITNQIGPKMFTKNSNSSKICSVPLNTYIQLKFLLRYKYHYWKFSSHALWNSRTRHNYKRYIKLIR